MFDGHFLRYLRLLHLLHFLHFLHFYSLFYLPQGNYPAFIVICGKLKLPNLLRGKFRLLNLLNPLDGWHETPFNNLLLRRVGLYDMRLQGWWLLKVLRLSERCSSVSKIGRRGVVSRWRALPSYSKSVSILIKSHSLSILLFVFLLDMSKQFLNRTVPYLLSKPWWWCHRLDIEFLLLIKIALYKTVMLCSELLIWWDQFQVEVQYIDRLFLHQLLCCDRRIITDAKAFFQRYIMVVYQPILFYHHVFGIATFLLLQCQRISNSHDCLDFIWRLAELRTFFKGRISVHWYHRRECGWPSRRVLTTPAL